MTYNVFGGTLNLAQSINHRSSLITSSDGEDLLKVGTYCHLLVELRGLGQVRTALEVCHLKHVSTTFRSSCTYRQ